MEPQTPGSRCTEVQRNLYMRILNRRIPLHNFFRRTRSPAPPPRAPRHRGFAVERYSGIRSRIEAQILEHDPRMEDLTYRFDTRRGPPRTSRMGWETSEQLLIPLRFGHLLTTNQGDPSTRGDYPGPRTKMNARGGGAGKKDARFERRGGDPASTRIYTT